MRFVCISDTHGHHKSLNMPEGDILIHAGDITHFGKQHQLEDFNSWLRELNYKEKFIIAGNHECNSNQFNIKNKITNGIYLDENNVIFDDLNIFGIKFFPGSYNKTIPNNTDIVISHNPPKGIGDGANKCIISDLGGGCLNLLSQIRKIKPKLHVFGHVHTGYGIYTFPNTQLENTTFINAAICGGIYNYALTNEPIVFSL